MLIEPYIASLCMVSSETHLKVVFVQKNLNLHFPSLFGLLSKLRVNYAGIILRIIGMHKHLKIMLALL